MKDFNYYKGDDIPTASSFLISFIKSVVCVDIDAVKEVTLDSNEIQVLLNKRANVVSARFRDDNENAELNITPRIISQGDEALKAKIIKLVEADENIKFKSLDFDFDGFNAKTKELVDERNARMDEFKKDAEAHHNMESFSDKLKSAIHAKAWDSGHSSGLQEVFNQYDDYVEIADIALGLGA